MEKGCVVQDKIEGFVEKVESCKKFEIAGLNEDETKFVLRDTMSDSEYGIKVSVEEIVEKPLEQIWAVINNERAPIVCIGKSRVVGYLSNVKNWNKSKVGELRDRVKGRQYGGYGFNSTEVDVGAFNDALATVDNL